MKWQEMKIFSLDILSIHNYYNYRNSTNLISPTCTYDNFIARYSSIHLTLHKLWQLGCHGFHSLVVQGIRGDLLPVIPHCGQVTQVGGVRPAQKNIHKLLFLIIIRSKCINCLIIHKNKLPCIVPQIYNILPLLLYFIVRVIRFITNA